MAAALMFKNVTTHAPGRLILEGARRGGLQYLANTSVLHLDQRVGGVFRIDGRTLVAGPPDVPVSRRVCLFNQVNQSFMARETWSAADGTFSFANINAGPWMIVAYDHAEDFKSVGVDRVSLPQVQPSIDLRFGDSGSILNTWNGTVWVSGRLKRWTGSEWVLV